MIHRDKVASVRFVKTFVLDESFFKRVEGFHNVDFSPIGHEKFYMLVMGFNTFDSLNIELLITRINLDGNALSFA